MDSPHCSLNYHRFGILPLETFAGGVKTGIYTNDPPFTTPPITEAAFELLIENYHHRYEEYKNGGKLLKPDFLIAKAALIAGLDTTANFVDELPGLTDNIIMMGGYTPVKTVDSEAQTPGQPAGAILSRGGSGEMFAEVPPVDGAEYYGCILIVGSPLPTHAFLNAVGQFVVQEDNAGAGLAAIPGATVFMMDINKNRKKHFLGLTPGTMYYFYFYAANAAGVSILSDVRNMICG